MKVSGTVLAPVCGACLAVALSVCSPGAGEGVCTTSADCADGEMCNAITTRCQKTATRPGDDFSFGGWFSCQVHKADAFLVDGQSYVLGRYDDQDLDFITGTECYRYTSKKGEDRLHIGLYSSRPVEGTPGIVEQLILGIDVLPGDVGGSLEVPDNAISPAGGKAGVMIFSAHMDVATGQLIDTANPLAVGIGGTIGVDGSAEIDGTINGTIELTVRSMTQGSSEVGYPCIDRYGCNINANLSCLYFEGYGGLCGTTCEQIADCTAAWADSMCVKLTSDASALCVKSCATGGDCYEGQDCLLIEGGGGFCFTKGVLQ